MKRVLLVLLLLVSVCTSIVLVEGKKEEEVGLLVIEFLEKEGKLKPELAYAIPPTDNSMTNLHYVPLSFTRRGQGAASYWVNPSNRYGFSSSQVVNAITSSANTWDSETSAAVFSYSGVTTLQAGRRDSKNVISFGKYGAGAIAVTYIWYVGSVILETDTRLNTVYKWSLSGEAGKMDVQDIMTHEYGHWFGLADLYSDADYWLTMYGYAGYGETYKRTLGQGDINGLESIYGP